MAIEAKAAFMLDLEARLGEIISAADLSKVLSAVADQMHGYMIVQKEADNEEHDDLVDAYIAALQVRGLSAKTINLYKLRIRKMMEAVKVPTRNITVYHIRQYLADEKKRGLSDRTIEGVRENLNAYFNWLQREGLISKNPVANIGAIKYAKKTKDIFTESEIERLKYCCKTLRDRAIISFLASTGCRVTEMTQLDRNSVDLTKLECTVFGKGAKERTVYLDDVTGMLLKWYLEQRKDDNPALFVGLRKKRLESDGVRKMLCVLGKKAEVENVHPHKFRRTLATNLIRHGMAIQEVAAILGHDKLDTTMQYVILDKSDIKYAYSKYA